MHSDLFAFDLDGTLVHPEANGRGRAIPTRVLDALDGIANRAHILVATGRRFRLALEDLKDLPPLPFTVVNNGQVVKDDHGRTVFRQSIALEQGKKIAQIFEDLGQPYFFVVDGFEDGVDFLFIDRHLKTTSAVQNVWERNYRFSLVLQKIEDAESLFSQIPLLEVMSLGDLEEMKVLEKAVRPKLPEGFRTVLVRNIGWPGWAALEICPEEISKWSGVKYVQEQLKAKRVIAIGDDENDREMLQYAELSVAMKHAEPHLRALSKCEVDGPHGLAEYLSGFYSTREQ